MAEKQGEQQTRESVGGEDQLVVVSDVPEAEETPTIDEKASSFSVPEAELLSPKAEEKPSPPPPEKEATAGVSHLPENEKKALQELKRLVQEALSHHDFAIDETPPPTHEEKPAQSVLEDDGAKTLEAIEETIVACTKPSQEDGSQEVFIWGVKLLEDERSDVILLKFLQARDFKVKDAFTMIKNTIKWRKEFGIDQLVEEDVGLGELDRVVFMHGCSKEGHPVCYNVYGEFQNKELYEKVFSDEEKRQRFLRWRVQFLEKSIRKLDFSYGGISTIVHVNDLKNSPGPNRWELRQATNQALQLLQDNYPEFVAKQVFINVPWWYLALSKMICPFLTQRTKSKFVVSKSAETLFKYICAEEIPTQYGGLSKDGEFGAGDSITETIVKPSAKHIVEFPVSQGSIVSWELRVVGWEVRYGVEFVPTAQEAYTVIIQKMRRIGCNEEQVMCGSFKATETGNLVIAIHNLSSNKKKLLYRFKTKLSN